MARKWVFTPIFCLHIDFARLVDMDFGYSLLDSHVLLEIYPLVPFPSLLMHGVFVYRSCPLLEDTANPSRRLYSSLDLNGEYIYITQA